ncbi:MAG: hypothetical protein FJ301_05680 [Planctomycetes bacterium]|nr:hypothetical protein [Planctomycetota bacterium]
MTLTQRDDSLLQRHLDGELPADAAAAFAARLLVEPELARAVDAARAQRALLRTAAGSARQPSARFAAGVVAAARQLPTRQQLEQADLVATAIRVCRQVLVAAAIVAAVGALWHAGMIGPTRTDTLQASPGALEQDIHQLDIRIQSGAVPPPATERSR